MAATKHSAADRRQCPERGVAAYTRTPERKQTILFGIFSSFCFSTAAAAAAAAAAVGGAVGGAASFCTYSLQNFLFHFPFDEIYRRLLFFTLGRSVSA